MAKPNSKNSNGFSIIEGLLILAIIGIIGGMGWFVWNAHNKTTDTFNNADAANSSVAKYPAAKTSTENSMFKIPEFGVHFLVPGTLNDLTYKIADYTDEFAKLGQLAYISTTKLNNTENGRCSIASASPTKGTIPPLGFVSKTDGQYPAEATSDNSSGTLVKQFSSFYISYRSPGLACFETDAAKAQETSLRNQLTDALKGVEEIK